MAVLPFRLRVLHAVTDAIKTVTQANGYAHDLSDFEEGGVTMKRVFRGRDTFGHSDPRPMVSILEHPAAADALLAPNGEPERVGEWDLLIQGFAEDDDENPTDPAHLLVADVIKALAKEARRKGPNGREPDILGLGSRMPCVTKMAIGQQVARPPDGEIADVANFFLKVTLTLAEDVEQPFA